MSSTLRVNPRRPSIAGPAGVRRVVLRRAVPAERSPEQKSNRLAGAPSQWVMAIAHADRGSLPEHGRQAVAAAAILAGPNTGVIAVVIGECGDDLSDCGADLVAAVPSGTPDAFDPELKLAAVIALISKYSPLHILMPDSGSGDGDLGRRLIARLKLPAATRVGELDHNHVAISRTAGAGLSSSPLPRIILLEPGAVSTDLPFEGAGRKLEATEMPIAPAITSPYRDLGLQDAEAAAIPLEEADFIVSAGHGVRNVATLGTLAHSLGASIGASRVAVDEGRFARDRQIGATGKTVSASTYVAVGISGAVQHLQGIKDCRHVISINKDAGAPIVKRADLAIVGDAEEVMQALITRIAQAQKQRELPEAE